MMDLDEDSVGTYLLIVDRDGRYMLWPSIKGVPHDWCIVDGPASRSDCLATFERESAPALPRRARMHRRSRGVVEWIRARR